MTPAGKLAENVMHFARALRAAGMAIGPDRVLSALSALEVVGIGRRDDFKSALAAVFLDRREQRELFDEAFDVFWRDPDFESRVRQLLLPKVEGRSRRDEIAPRLADALARPASSPHARERAAPPQVEFDAALTFSPREVLQHKDFERMSAQEMVEAKAAIAQLGAWLPALATRRYAPAARGARADPRASLRAALRSGSALIPLKRRARTERRPPLIVLADISGSMQRYSRMLLAFAHALASDDQRVYTFTFATRLTNVTRMLRQRDVDVALDAASRAVPDWAGGTRIGACLAEFNRWWSRRVPARAARVLLVSDGLDRDNAAGLAREMERLRKSCRELVWLNPLLRYAGFEAKAAGIRAMLPHADAFLPAHNLQSLADLAAHLAAAPTALQRAA